METDPYLSKYGSETVKIFRCGRGSYLYTHILGNHSPAGNRRVLTSSSPDVIMLSEAIGRRPNLSRATRLKRYAGTSAPPANRKLRYSFPPKADGFQDNP